MHTSTSTVCESCNKEALQGFSVHRNDDLILDAHRTTLEQKQCLMTLAGFPFTVKRV